MELTIELLQKLCHTIRWSVHASERIHQRGIFREDVIHAIRTGEIIESYPNDSPFPSCLILGVSAKGKYLHVVCGCDGEKITIITAYFPTEDKFEPDMRTRKEK